MKKNYEISYEQKNILKQFDKLNNEFEKFSMIVNQTDIAIFVMDISGNIEWINKGFKHIYGYSNEDMKSLAGKNLSDKSFVLEFSKTLKQCIETKTTIIYEALIVTKSGEKMWVQTTLTPILDEKSEVKKLIAIDSNINKIKEAEQEIEAQREEIIRQRDIVTKQKEKVTNSILYAKRIQDAVLPPTELIKELLLKHFILFKPRDIVSGDFYWMTRKENKVILAVADCTGHGVPGAFMSMLGIAFLNEIVNKIAGNKHIYSLQANEILNQLRVQVITSLNQTGKKFEPKDGMDITLCIIDFEKKTLQYAGANNPFLLLRDGRIYRYEPDRMPIGIHQKARIAFTNNEIDLQSNDLIYLFTDGFYEQLDDTGESKFLFENFQDLLLSIQNYPLLRQKEILNNAFERWKGSYNQLDDVLVVGLVVPEQMPVITSSKKYNWKDKKILIAEDTEVNYILLVKVLAEFQVIIKRARNGIEAVEICKSDEHFDLILMDLNMPKMNGFRATSIIRKYRKEIPIIAQTALKSQGSRERSLEAGCNEFLLKPIKRDIFLSVINKYLGD
jgi:PAS domain S-box-containing protein